MQLLARTEGIFAETAGGVTVATLKKLAADGVVRPDERVVVYITGHGLKTLEAVAPTCGPTATIAPTLDAFHEAFDIEESSWSARWRHGSDPHAAAQPLRRRGRGVRSRRRPSPRR